MLPNCLFLETSPALFISAIGEIAWAYVAIAVSNRAKHMCNGNLQQMTRQVRCEGRMWPEVRVPLEGNWGSNSPRQCRCNGIPARGPACGVCPPDRLLIHPELSTILIVNDTLGSRTIPACNGIYTRARWPLSHTDECGVALHVESALLR